MNILGKGPQNKLSTKCQRPRPLVSYKKIFKTFPHKSLCKTSDLRDDAFLPLGHNSNNRGGGHLPKGTY